MNAILIIALAALPLQDQKADLKALEWLSGTWTGGNDLPGLGKVSEKMAISWIHNGTFLRGDYEARQGDKVVWTDVSYFGWDFGKKRLTSRTFSMDGSYGEAVSVEPAGKDSWTFDGKSVRPGGTTEERATLRREGPDEMVIAVELKKDGRYPPGVTFTYSKFRADQSTPRGTVESFFGAAQREERDAVYGLMTPAWAERERSWKQSFTTAMSGGTIKIKTFKIREPEGEERVSSSVKAVFTTADGKDDNEGMRFERVQKDGKWWIDKLD